MDACWGLELPLELVAKGDFLELMTAKWNLAEGRVAILRFGKCSRLRKQWCLRWVSAKPGRVRAGAHRNEGASDLERSRVDSQMAGGTWRPM